MKIIINTCYGGFCVIREIAETLGYESLDRFGDEDDGIRTCPELIKMIEEGKEVSEPYSSLRVVDIPDEATDYFINEYDGLESVIYVVNGKIFIEG